MAGEASVKLKGQLTLIERENSMKNMSLVQSFKLLLKTEPEKTLMKVGITDEQDNLTTDGKALYDAWKFQQDKAAFTAAVATPLLADQEAEKKN